MYPRLVLKPIANRRRPKPISSGIPRLDALLGGGLDAGTSTLMMGPPGSGKSALASQYAMSVASRGMHAAIFTFEESMARCSSVRTGWGWIFAATFATGGSRRARSIRLNSRRENSSIWSGGPSKCDGARLIVIDSLNGYLNAMPQEHYLLSQLHELFMYLGERGVVTLLGVAQQGLVGTMTSPLDASYLADNVILLRYFEAEGRIRKAISVVKRRSGAHEDTIREFALTSKGLQIGEPLMHFRGVLTGVPTYTGERSPLMETSIAPPRE